MQMHISYDFTAKDIRFSRDGKIFVKGTQVGEWKVSYPRKQWSKYCSRHKSDIEPRQYDFGIWYGGRWTTDKRKEMVAKVLEYATTKGFLIPVKQ